MYSQEDLDEAVKRETEALRKQVRTLKVRPPVHTILSRKRGFSKTLFIPPFLFSFRVELENILKIEFFQNDEVTIITIII